MDNFQYSVQLSDREWAEFSATADECGLLQAGLASGDELLSSDIDQGDSSGSSPPGPPPLFIGQLDSRGRGQQGCEVEYVATQQLVSRSQCEPVLAQGSSQQVAGTSIQSEGLLFLCPDGALPDQGLSLPGSATSRDKMQRLLQGPAPSPSGESSRSPESPGHSATPQRTPDSPGASLWSPGRKKRRAVGTKGSKCSGPLGPTTVQMGSSLLSETRPEEGLATGPEKLMAKDQQNKPEPDSAGASEHGSSTSEQVARQGSGLDLSTPVLITKQGTDQIRMTPRAELHMVSKPVQEAHSDVFIIKPDVTLSIPVSKSQPDTALSILTSKPQPYMVLSEHTSESQSDLILSTHASKYDILSFKLQQNMNLSTPALDPEKVLSAPASMPQLDKAESVSACTPQLHVDLPAAGPGIKTEVDSSMPASVVVLCTDLPHSVSQAESEVGVSTPAMPFLPPVSKAEAAMVDTEVIVPPGEHLEKPGRELSPGTSGYSSVESCLGPVQNPKKKKVRFSMAVPSHEESGSGEPTGPPSLTSAWPPAPRTASGSRGGSTAWDAVAVGSRPPQPRILKHLPPPTPSASKEPEPRSCFAVTLPEAYEFFFCDTIKEEDEDVEDEAAASQALDEVQWPDTCEFFFQDCQAQRSSCQRGHSPAPLLRAEAVADAPPGDLVPISIPEAYEHFFSQEGFESTLPPTTFLQLQTSELSREVGPEAFPKPASETAEQLGLIVREPGRCGLGLKPHPGPGNTL
uniref:PPARGC1 and ESRR induced regulator, muscle 1 n=1 Tax=Nannospalax galili TaxID=1026970 RepID=A0A8C6QQ12_NANGA